jgi:hypothetical protein
MYKEEDLSPSQKALESALGQLKPITNTMNRDELMFNAGRASVRGKLHWQMLSGTLAVLLICSFLFRSDMNETYNLPAGTQHEQIQIAQTQYQPAETSSFDSMSYPILRENVIKYGLDALQSQQSTSQNEPPLNRKQWLIKLRVQESST